MTYITTAPLGHAAKVASPVRLLYCLYARKSTEQEDKQVLSIDSQIKEMEKMAAADNLEIVVMKKESHSAKEAGQRPVFNEIVEELKQGKYNGILTWAPDRIARNAGDLGRIVDLMDQKKLIEIRTYGQKFMNTPNDKFMLMILGSQAKLENDNKVINVKRGLRTRAAMGLRPSMAPTGYLNSKNKDEKCQVIVDAKRAPVIKQMFEKVANENYSGRKVFKWLKEIEFKNKNGKYVTLGNIYRMLRMTFYYGVFEYPEGSGEWFTGKHIPIISQSLFEAVQEKIKVEKKKAYGREFAFTRMLHCAYCESGITAEEKIKELKDGGSNAHVYYRCTKVKNRECPNESVKESILIDEMLPIIDKMSLDKSELKHKLQEEVARYALFQTGVLGVDLKQSKKHKDISIKVFAKHMLVHGTMLQKREVLSCIKSRILLKDKKLTME
ncbi:MAG TPA: recombinase family protein [Candidatus Paceibacterota bacterium]|jgi:DNA invertase Pin-like site-specific DNA recombinase|nr:recombinase family protein [Candidatus Paceibacterota bacterium]